MVACQLLNAVHVCFILYFNIVVPITVSLYGSVVRLDNLQWRVTGVCAATNSPAAFTITRVVRGRRHSCAHVFLQSNDKIIQTHNHPDTYKPFGVHDSCVWYKPFGVHDSCVHADDATRVNSECRAIKSTVCVFSSHATRPTKSG